MGHMLHSRDEPRMQSVTHLFFIKEILQILLGVMILDSSSCEWAQTQASDV